jgi:hypothetical protein
MMQDIAALSRQCRVPQPTVCSHVGVMDTPVITLLAFRHQKMSLALSDVLSCLLPGVACL